MQCRTVRGLFSTSALALAISMATPAWADQAQPQTDGDAQEIVVVGLAIAEDRPASATGLSLTLRETPQSITVLDRVRIEDFALTNTAQLLEQVVGLNVERGESDRTVFNARGFDVTNIQVDGIGIPLLFGIQYGESDTLFYERIEVIRGANGLTTGVGNPSATINYIRKRPHDERRLQMGAYVGSFNMWRVEADANIPLAEGVALRLVGANEQRDSHLINYDMKRSSFGATLEAAITPELMGTLGYTYQHNLSHGSGWGSVTHHYSDGGRIDHDRSANFSPSWANWPVMDEQAFGEIAYSPGGDWTVKGVLTYKRFIEAPTLLYVFGNPDRETGLGLFGYPADFRSDYKRYMADLYAAGSFSLFGRKHQLTLGTSWTQSDGRQWQGLATTSPIFPDFRNLQNVQPERPEFNPLQVQLDERETLKRAYVATQLNFADWLKAVVGTSYANFKTTGVNYGVDSYRQNTELNPYVGVLVDPLPDVTVYGSYTTIFNPQKELDADRVRLDPVRGSNLELGVKGELLDNKLLVAAAIFRTQQNGLAEFAGTIIDEDGPFSYYNAVDSTTEGFEIELAGHLSDVWQLSGGYTGLRIQDDNGDATRTFQPRKTLKLSSTYRFPEFRNLALGGQFRWQSATYDMLALLDSTGNAVEFRQNAYAVGDLMAGIDLSDVFRATLNVRNITNKKYMHSMVYAASDQGLYAPGRNFNFSVSAKF